MFYISNPALTPAFTAPASLRCPMGTAVSFGAGSAGSTPAAA
ncbi:hypothetical protein [Microbacterium wangruii]|nr:hypothetical protein [Microbacterium sp. zg-Y1211]MDL5487602.1 hypothetical protein [Microbacterium sp. zg-Y1211]